MACALDENGEPTCKLRCPKGLPCDGKGKCIGNLKFEMEIEWPDGPISWYYWAFGRQCGTNYWEVREEGPGVTFELPWKMELDEGGKQICLGPYAFQQKECGLSGGTWERLSGSIKLTTSINERLPNVSVTSKIDTVLECPEIPPFIEN